ncbi:MAG: hypothetical protein WCI79_01475 [Candidatus Saccharibacteria bacterium]
MKSIKLLKKNKKFKKLFPVLLGLVILVMTFLYINELLLNQELRSSNNNVVSNLAETSDSLENKDAIYRRLFNAVLVTERDKWDKESDLGLKTFKLCGDTDPLKDYDTNQFMNLPDAQKQQILNSKQAQEHRDCEISAAAAHINSFMEKNKDKLGDEYLNAVIDRAQVYYTN